MAVMHAGVVGVLDGAVDDDMVGRVTRSSCYSGLVKTKSGFDIEANVLERWQKHHKYLYVVVLCA